MEYTEVRAAIDAIIGAIREGKYEVCYEEANNIWECTAPDGRTFYKVVDMDGIKTSTDFGTCYVYVNEYSFTCDLGTGEYESSLFDDIENKYTLADGTTVKGDDLIEEIIDAFNHTDDICFGEYSSMDEQMEIFAMINNIKDPEYYWCEDSDCPIDIEDKWTEFTPPIKLGYGTVVFNGEEYDFVEKADEEAEEGVHAVRRGEAANDEGYFKTVLLTVEFGEGGKINVTACEESEDLYNAVECEIEEGW